MTSYRLYRPIVPPEVCYLQEVLHWRAMGRFPEVIWWDGEGDFRLSEDDRCNLYPELPIIHEFDDHETLFAGLPPDPGIDAYRDGPEHIMPYDEIQGILLKLEAATFSPEVYERWSGEAMNVLAGLNILRNDKLSQDEKDIGFVVTNDIHRAHAYRVEMLREDWLKQFRRYIGKFEMTTCLDLMEGRLVAYGIPMPVADDQEAEDLFANSEFVESEKLSGRNVSGHEGQEPWNHLAEPVAIPAGAWHFNDVYWGRQAIFSPDGSYVHIHVKAEDMLAIYPPDPAKFSNPTGEILLVNEGELTSQTRKPDSAYRGRGRPHKDWTAMHVEIARLIKAGEFPASRKAAAGLLARWWNETRREEVTDRTIYDFLAPYYQSIDMEP